MARGTKRALSLLLAFCMALSAAVTAAAAEDGAAAGKVYKTTGDDLQATIQKVIKENAEGATVKLTSDCTTTDAFIRIEGVAGESPLTIDLGTHTLTFKNESGTSQGLWANGTNVILKNGVVKSDSAGTSTALFINNGGSITLDRVTVDASKQVDGNAYAATLRGGSLTVDAGSSLTSSTNAAIYGYGEDENNVDVSGTVTHTGTFSAIEGSYASTGSMTIRVHEGAEIDGKDGAGILQMAPGSVTVDGGSITGCSGIVITKGKLNISGGEISGSGDYQEYEGTANFYIFDNGAAVYIEPVAAGTNVTVSGGELRSDNSYALSAPEGGNKKGNLTLAITDGVFIGSGEKGALDAKGEDGAVSGGAFSSPVDKELLSGALKYQAQKSGGDAPYSYHETQDAAQKAAGKGGTATDLKTDVSSPGVDDSATYKITVQSADNGSVTATPDEAQAGDTITLTVSPNTGYRLAADSLKVTWGDGKTVSVTGSGTSYTFQMPAGDVTVTAAFEKIETGGGDPSKPDDPNATYTITIVNGIANGAVYTDKTTAKKGETVTLTFAPNNGYYLYSVNTTPTLTLSGSGNTRTFTMPAGNVTVSASFALNSSGSYLTGYVDIEGGPWVGETLYARVYDTNNTGVLYYQWTADGYNLYGETSRYLDLTRYEVGKVIRCVVTSSAQIGSISGRLWRTVDYYDGRYYPPNNSTNNNTSSSNNNNNNNNNNNSTSGGANQSGSGNDNTLPAGSPVVATATNADGTKTTTIIEPDGSSGFITLTSYGTVSSASMTFSSSAYASAQRTGTALAVPTTVQPSRSAESAAPVRIVLPQATGSVKVKIPVTQMTAGTVAMMENAFGPDTVIKSSVSGGDGVVFELTGSAVVKVVENSKSFSDVFDSEWFAGAVKWASSREVMNGVSAQRFDPQGTVNRAMMAQMLYNYDGAGSTDVVSQFSDVSSGDWYAASVSWAKRNGIARDYGDRFGAEDALTREDMAYMLYNYAKAVGYTPNVSSATLTFSDSGSVSGWAFDAMRWAVATGLINGTQNGSRAIVLDPQGTVTRAQLATIMQRFNNAH